MNRMGMGFVIDQLKVGARACVKEHREHKRGGLCVLIREQPMLWSLWLMIAFAMFVCVVDYIWCAAVTAGRANTVPCADGRPKAGWLRRRSPPLPLPLPFPPLLLTATCFLSSLLPPSRN